MNVKRFRDAVSERGQFMLLPPCVDDFIPRDHSVRAFDDILGRLDYAPLDASYPGGGAPAYDPRMMVGVTLYGVWRGVRSSRDLARQLEESLPFRWLSRMQCPSYATIARFMQRHGEDLGALFVQTVELAQELKLVSLGDIAIDGQAIEANVSGKNTYSKARIEKAKHYVDGQIALWLERDKAEDGEFGDRRGDELPKDLATLEARRKRLDEIEKQRKEKGRNSIAVTDPQSSMMRVRGARGIPMRWGLRPAHNAQAGVDEAYQVIVAADVILAETDNSALPGVVEQVIANTGQSPERVLADAGYSGPAMVACAEGHPKIDFYVAQQDRKSDKRESFTHDKERDVMIDREGREHFFTKERTKHGTTYRIYKARGTPKSELWEPTSAEFTQKMREKLSTPEGKSIYNLRKQTVEPVFGMMKTRMQMRRFLRRGHQGVKAEFLLACIAHNVGKIMRYGRAAMQPAGA